jgi:hypothetical protein
MSAEIDLRAFNIGSIKVDQVEQIQTRLILLNTRPGTPSEYIVTAFPKNAKQKTSGLTVTTWPEVVLGIIAEIELLEMHETNRSQRSWTLHPTLRSGRGWRKKSIMTVGGRSNAARSLLEWTALANDKRGS